jgi:hypothetical protein
MLALALMLQNSPDPAQIQRMALGLLAILPFIILFGLAILVIPFWFICKKAGFSPWLSMLNVVPLGNLILIYVLAFAEWKTSPIPQAVWQPPFPQPPAPPAIPPQA